MATVSLSPPADQAADLLQNLSLDSQAKEGKISEPAKKPNVATAKLQSTDRSRSTTPSLKDSTMPYHPNGYASSAYYYGGYGGLEWGKNLNSGLLPRLGYGMDTARGLGGMYTNDLYGHNWNPYGLGMGFGSNSFGMARNGYGWTSLQNKYKSRGRGSTFRYGNQDIDGLDELNKGPRGKSYKTGVNMPLNKANDEKDTISTIPEREHRSGADIHDNYSDAKFFIIKSYSEDDVHKSVKYNVWASTPNGNKKLNAAYQEAQEKSGGCAVFLFFSVNASGQFVGLAEMVGPVDFNKNVEYWQQDKWTGCFPVKWHIVKDVPNSLLKHITLENNENKPVTNSRDTQEVKLEEGLKLIKLFKDHSSKTCLLDDFEFYEDRQKTIEEVKAKRQTRKKKVLEEKPTHTRNDGTEEALKSPESLGTALDMIKEPTPIDQSDEQPKPLENGSVAEAEDGLKGPEPVVSESEVIVTK